MRSNTQTSMNNRMHHIMLHLCTKAYK
uniref:Uncharacterized protein n=1 Tax=Arundo donax TaxID=35708 RepID=A0A0A9BSA1_ARUDO